MALEDYLAKRNFKQTPEPFGAVSHSSGGLRFVVQKHEASHLHYDFRLEIKGVLKSWAVPKGPSLNPADKRLAILVEDHPFDYRNFEGIIPAGQYGGGTVMVWDEGIYTHAGLIDRAAAEHQLMQDFYKGELKIVLAGSKLAGEFVLAKGGDQENSWFLIKARDQFSSEDDITRQDRSAATGRTMSEIASQPHGVWQSHRELDLSGAPEMAAPTSLQPMLAGLAPGAFNDPAWQFEIKWDGYRMMARTGRAAQLISRGNQDYSEQYATITEALGAWQTEAVIDGEMVVVDADGRSHFQWLQHYPDYGGQLVYYVFDVVWVAGHDVTGWPLERRRELLRRLLPPEGVVVFSDQVMGEGEAFLEAARQAGLEGVMAKRLGSIYQAGRRSPDWLKIKLLHEQEAVICGYTEPRGSRRDLGALVLGLREEDSLRYIGHTGGGIDARERSRLLGLLKPLERKTSPFEIEIKPNAPVHWVTPKLVTQVKFNGWTASGSMRQPIYMGLRTDKPAREVTREEPVPSSGTFHVSHPDKVFWPKDGYTKNDLAVYYSQIAPTLVPYLAGRPESLHRHPNGIHGQSFFQKNIDHELPEFIETVKIHSEGEERDINYLLCNNADTLEYLVNLGCIELNPWHSRVGQLDQPDYLLLDIDAKSARFDQVLKVTTRLRDVLKELRIESFPKTSGKTGLHICIPLGARYSYEQSKQLAELFMRLALRELGDIASIERSPAKREDKVYLDYLQNRRGQTMAAPYCVRPVPGATVSTPLAWDEVNGSLDPGAFTIHTLPERLKRVGDLWQPVLGSGVDVTQLVANLDV